jgi:hypothetical protein
MLEENMNLLKRCNKCGKFLPLSMYHTDNHAPDKHKYSCKECSIKSVRQWEKDNPKKKKANDASSYNRRRDYILQQKHEYYLDNTDSIREYNLERARRPDVKVRNKILRQHRKKFGCTPINEPFNDSHFHHLHLNNDHSIGLFMPAGLHNSIYHNSKTMVGMDIINNAAFNWYFKEHLGYTIEGLI